MKSVEGDACDGDGDNTDLILFENVSTPSSTIGASAAKTGGRWNVFDISLTHLRTELRNKLAGLKSKQPTKGLTCAEY